MRLTDLVCDLIRELDSEIAVKISSKHRGYRNSISPSLWKLKKDMKKQATHFFDPDILFNAGIIKESEVNTLRKYRSMDAGGLLNCAVGTLIHALLLPELEKHLNGLGVKCVTEFPVWSKETGVYGTVDMIVFNDDTRTMDIYDLKTTGEKILERNDHIDDGYARQLYCYAATLECMYPEWSIGELSILSVCKVPNSSATNSDGERVKLPVAAQCWIDYGDLDDEYHQLLETLRNETVAICKQIRTKYENYPLWLIDDSTPCFGEMLRTDLKWVKEL